MRLPLFACTALAFSCLTIPTLLGVSSEASAQALANDMTCDQAIAYFEENGRIEAKEGNQVLPIYGGEPVSKQDELQCGADNSVAPIMLQTKDRDGCLIGYRCE